MEVLKCGDCYKAIKDIPDKSIDLVYIDPPYLVKNMGAGGGMLKNEKRKKGYEEVNKLMQGIDYSIFDELKRVMKEIYIYIWCSKEQIQDIINYWNNDSITYEILVWCKTNPTPFCKNTWLPDVEYCLLFRKKGTKLNDGYKLKSKWYLSPTNTKDRKKYKHPTIKPLELVERHILHSTEEGDTVLDCFMGSGTTGVACKKLNRNFIGIELDEKYFNIAKERINNTLENKECVF